MGAPDPVLAFEIARVQRLEKEGKLRWDQAADLIEKLHTSWDIWYGDPKTLSVFDLGHLPLLDLRSLYFLVCPPVKGAWVVPIPTSREQLVDAILDRVS